MQGPDLKHVQRELVRRKLIPEWVKPNWDTSPTRKKANPKNLTLFTRQFASLIDAGIPLIQAIELGSQLTTDKGLQEALVKVSVDVQSGKTLANAMRLHPRVFPSIFANMVEAGEAAGVLDTILERLATYLEKSQALAEKMKSAMVYPAVILLVAILCAAAMLTFVVPTFEEMFSSGGFELPLPTRVLVESSDFLVAYWIQLLAGIGIAFYLLRRFYATKAGHDLADALALKIPILGDLLRKTAVARFTQSMASLLEAGVSLIAALISSASTSGNSVIEKGILAARTPIEAGQGIAVSLKAIGGMPDLVAQMVEVGEQTGTLPEMFHKVSRFYEGEVETAADRLMKALEPVLICVVGVIMGGMVAALYLPIFEALTNID